MPSEIGPHRKRRRLVWALAGIAFIAAVLAVVIGRPPETTEKLVWMTPAQLTRTLKPGKLTLLKYRVMRWPGPWRWFTSHKRQILIETHLVELPEGTGVQAPQGGFCQTNREGKVAWIVEAEDLEKVSEAFSASGANVRSVGRVTTCDGMQASLL